MSNEAQDINNLKEDGCLFQVVDMIENGVILLNTRNDVVFEEKNISKELINKLGNDYILKYENGEYIFEEELTEEFFDSLLSINEFEDIKNKFIKESNILEIDSQTRYNVLFREDDYSILSYGNDKNQTIMVPNELLPYFINDNTILYYKNGKFEKYLHNFE